MRPSIARLVSLVCLASALASPPAHAEGQPMLEVRGRLRLELESLERVGRGLLVTGLLLDEALGEPMPAWTVALRLGREDAIGRETFVYGHAVPVDLDGRFRFEVPNLARARYVVHLAAPGDERYAEPMPLDRPFDLARRAIDLRLFVPAEQSAAISTVQVAVEAVALERSAAAAPALDAAVEPELPVELELDGRSVANLMLKEGRGSLSLLLPPGAAGRELVLRASFAGDDSRGPAEASARLRLVEPAILELAADPARVAAGAEVTLRGQLRFGARTLGGLPILLRRVAMLDDDGVLIDGDATVARTAADGSFSATLRAPERGSRASFEAAFSAAEAKQRGLPAATSELALVELRPGFSLAGLGGRAAGIALLVAVVVVLSVLVLRLLAALAARRPVPVPRPGEPAAVPPRRGMAERLLGTLRLASDRRIAGRVRDADRGRPLAGVRIELRAGGHTDSRLSDQSGAYSFGEHERGPVELHYLCRGYLPQSRLAALPHRGELATLDVELVPLRVELLRLYGEALRPYLPGREQLGPRTPRELESLVLVAASSARIDRAALLHLRRAVEEGCFGPAPAEPESLRALAEQAARLAPGTRPDEPLAPR